MTDLHRRRSAARTRLVAVLMGAVLACTATWQTSASADAVPDAHIIGRVTNHAGEPVAGAGIVPYVLYQGRWVEGVSVRTAADGFYDIRTDPGTYRIRFLGSADGLGEYYDDAGDFEDAASITVATTASGVDATLDQAASVRVVLTDRAGALIPANVDVTLYRHDDVKGWIVAAQGQARGGIWQLDAVRAGVYRLGFSNQPDRYSDKVRLWATQFYPDVLSLDQAQDIPVGEGDHLSLDVMLHPPSHVAGTVTVPPGAPLDQLVVSAVQAPGPGAEHTTVRVGLDGSYDLGGLDPGDYVVRFGDNSGVAASQYFDNASTFQAARVVTVGRETTVHDVDADLAPGSELAGRVTGEDGVGAYHAVVTAYEPFRGSWRAAQEVLTEWDGTWMMLGMPGGTYRIGVDDRFHEELESEFYDDATSVDGARDVVLGPDALITGVDLVLAPFGTLPPAPAPTPLPLPAPVAAAGQRPVVSVLHEPSLPRLGLRAGMRARIVPGVYGPGTVLSYRWFADGRRITSALRPSLKVTTKLLGTKIRVRETAVVVGAAPVRTVLTFRGRVR